MRAAIYRGIGQIVVEELPVPEIGETEALVRVHRVGICGTDLKTYKRGHQLFKPPCVLGHELCGTVERTGARLAPDLVGRTFVFAPYLECGECTVCRRGLPQQCAKKDFVAGALAEYIRVPGRIMERGALELPAGLDRGAATLTEPMACAIHGIQRARVATRSRSLVIGGGPMGLLLGIGLQAIGCEVSLSEINETRLARAAALGLGTIDAKVQSYEDLTRAGSLFDQVLLANERADLVPPALRLVAPGGTLELFGGMSKEARLEIDPYLVHYKEVDLVGSFGFGSDDFRQAFALVSARAEQLRGLVSKTLPLDQVTLAFEEASRPENLKVVVEL